MAKIDPGLQTLYEYGDKTYLATALNTYTEDGTDYATLSLSGTDEIIKEVNDFDNIITPGGGSNIDIRVVDRDLVITTA